MSIYIEKAKELGQMILASEIAKSMADASAVYEADKDAVEQFESYKARVTAFQGQIQEGKLSEEEYNNESNALNEVANKLREYPSIAGIISAEMEFNSFVTEVMDVLRVTIMGQTGNACGSGGSCSGCKSDCNTM